MAKNHSREFLALVEAARGNVTEITVDEVMARRAAGHPIRLIDVREDSEWSQGHASSAEHVGRGVIERDIVQLVPDKATPLVLYCGGGFRSALAAESLQKMGYTNLRSMAGGWSEWLARGGPVEK